MTNFHLPSDGSVLVVDDKWDEALPLIQLLSSKGIPATYYSGAQSELPPVPIQKIRLAFFDIQLFPGGSSVNYASTILGLIERLIPEENGPYVLVLWSKRLETHAPDVRRRILSVQNSRRPLSIIQLDKSNYFTKTANEDELTEALASISAELTSSYSTEEVQRIASAIGPHIPLEEKYEPKSETALNDILAKLQSELSSNVECFELFTRWETEIGRAAGQTVAAYSELHRDEEHWSDNIKYIIYRMAHAQAGVTVDDLNQHNLIQNAMKTLNQTFLDDVEKNIGQSKDFGTSMKFDMDAISFKSSIKKSQYEVLWRATGKYQFRANGALVPPGSAGSGNLRDLRKRVTTSYNSMQPPNLQGVKDAKKVIDLFEAIKPEINGKLHIDSSVLTETGRDAIVSPGNLYSKPVRFMARRKELLKNYFSTGEQKTDLINLQGKFAINDRQIKAIFFVELEVTPPCDYAQKKRLKSRALPGVLIPAHIAEEYDLKGDYLYKEVPVFKVDGKKYKAVFDFRLFKSVDVKTMQGLAPPLLRFRAELLADIISKLSNHVNRLGIAFVA